MTDSTGRQPAVTDTAATPPSPAKTKGTLLTGTFACFRAVWPFLAVTIAGEFLLRLVLALTRTAGNGLNPYLDILTTGIRDKVLFGQILKGIWPAFLSLLLFMLPRNLLDLLINPGSYHAAFLHYRENRPSGFGQILPLSARMLRHFFGYRLLLLGLWLAFLLFSAIIMSSLLMVAVFLGRIAVAFTIFLFVIFFFACLAMPIRVALTFPASRIDSFHLDDAMRHAVKITSKPYHYLRLAGGYVPLAIAQLVLIWLCPMGTGTVSLLACLLTSAAAGVIRLWTVCFTVTAYMQIRPPREIDLNAIW